MKYLLLCFCALFCISFFDSCNFFSSKENAENITDSLPAEVDSDSIYRGRDPFSIIDSIKKSKDMDLAKRYSDSINKAQYKEFVKLMNQAMDQLNKDHSKKSYKKIQEKLYDYFTDIIKCNDDLRDYYYEDFKLEYPNNDDGGDENPEFNEPDEEEYDLEPSNR